MPAVLGNFSSSGEFVKQKVWESFPAFYRLATSQEAKSNETALYEALPGWEIAYLADGSVGGAEYGTFTKYALRFYSSRMVPPTAFMCTCASLHAFAFDAAPLTAFLVWGIVFGTPNKCLPLSEAQYMHPKPFAIYCIAVEVAKVDLNCKQFCTMHLAHHRLSRVAVHAVQRCSACQE